ncbi:uncharacterized protein LOC141633870 [Silene latifolia]|uniref:uncharacterized protein LOC141633870 n=1 Tax=Silene latifolia TaxID=37657 RepID=UPI003D775B32
MEVVSSAESGGVGGGGGGGEGGGAGVVDSGAGSIVWVRRRNGSWWPGRILGPQDLSASHLMSPRSGTPVKLLGREDASVDWYNLEKSKRVKAFRCGEFDDCIERASASQGLPTKKREKYARREDAILHALKLEKQFHEKKYGKLVKPLRENSADSERKITVAPLRASNDDLCQPGRKLGKSNLMEKNHAPLLAQKAKDAIHPGFEDHTITPSSRLRGLHELRYNTMPMNRMLNSTTSEDSNRTAIDGSAYAVSGSGPCLKNFSDSDSSNSIGKGKRLLDSFAEEPIRKRHHGLRPFVNVKQNSAELHNQSLQPDISLKGLSGDGMHFTVYTPAESSKLLSTNQGPQGQMETPFSRLEVDTRLPQQVAFVEEAFSGSSEETESDSSETHSVEPRVEAGMLLSDADTSMRAQSRLRDRLTMQAGQESISNDESDEPSIDNRSQFHYLDQNASGAEVSKWQLKGKRNVRNLGKRPTSGRPLNQSLSYYNDNDADLSEDDLDLHPHGYLLNEAAAGRQSYLGPNRNRIDWELAWGRPLRRYWEERGGCFSPMFNGRDMLIDVELTVQGKREGEHVPWVSLMSKLNGKAIIGHPIQIETLKDGSTEILMSTSDESDRGKVPPVWRTARRTPRPGHSPQMDVDETLHLHQSGKVRNSVSKGKKTAPRKGGHLPSNQKTKHLSSLGLDQKIKPIDSSPQTVACIPVKLAFSRLLEAVGRPPSGPAKHQGDKSLLCASL